MDCLRVVPVTGECISLNMGVLSTTVASESYRQLRSFRLACGSTRRRGCNEGTGEVARAVTTRTSISPRIDVECPASRSFDVSGGVGTLPSSSIVRLNCFDSRSRLDSLPRPSPWHVSLCVTSLSFSINSSEASLCHVRTQHPHHSLEPPIPR